MQMNIGLDTGDMLIKRTTPIGENETYEELYARLSVMGGEVLAETVTAIENGTLSPEKQDDEKSCYSPMIRKEMSALDFSSLWPCLSSVRMSRLREFPLAFPIVSD